MPYSHPTLSRLNALQLPRTVRLVAVACGWAFVALPLLALLAPWRQNVVGEGQVSAFTPAERAQTIDAPVGGRVVEWHVQEGSRVQAGDALLEISDIDPRFLERLGGQRDALAAKVEALEQQVRSYESQVESLGATRDLLVTTARHRLDTARERSRAANEALQAAQATLVAAEIQAARLRRLQGGGIVSRRDVELGTRDEAVARRSLGAAEATAKATLADLQAAEADVARIGADAQAKVESAAADLGKARSDLQDSRNGLARMEIDLSRQQAQTVAAPRDGTVFRLFGNPVGEVVKQGDPLLVLVPETTARAAEIWIRGVDAPLVTPGRHVRLQFEGWPAVQFVGWPSVAVGTFGGVVAFVDATDDGKGRFRAMVVPDEADAPWPSDRFLRQGVRARAWILLDEVRLGWEIWRQLNGFPPVIGSEEPKSEPKPDVARKRIK